MVCSVQEQDEPCCPLGSPESSHLGGHGKAHCEGGHEPSLLREPRHNEFYTSHFELTRSGQDFRPLCCAAAGERKSLA